MKDAVRAKARELGFDDCRFTTAAPPASAAHFLNWIASGRHGEMAWLQRNSRKRVDPALVLPGARTIITLATSYAGTDETAQPRLTASRGRPADGAPTGVISRYARYADYHDVLADRLESLSEFVSHSSGTNARSLWYVDTGPVLERDLAQRAGLGFIGKHTNLISRKLGNWFLISEILTTVEIEPDPPEKNRCGSCSRCISACPTQAIPGPFQLDARRCISYLTIELKGPIPVELRPLIGHRVYGCDDCLEACPWNRFAREGRVLRERARPELARPDLPALLALDEAGFRARFAGTPMWRAKRRGLLRNACVALGNVGDASCLPALRQAAADPEPLIAEHAVWAIERIEAGRTPHQGVPARLIEIARGGLSAK
jgi:epoxyqueuosine reductase